MVKKEVKKRVERKKTKCKNALQKNDGLKEIKIVDESFESVDEKKNSKKVRERKPKKPEQEEEI